jgi:hypothetical protein
MDWYSVVYLCVSNSYLGLCNNHLMWRQLREMWDKERSTCTPTPLILYSLTLLVEALVQLLYTTPVSSITKT